MHVLVVVLRVNQFNKIQSKRRHVKNKKFFLISKNGIIQQFL